MIRIPQLINLMKADLLTRLAPLPGDLGLVKYETGKTNLIRFK